MSEHSLKELQRQLDVAVSKLNEATAAKAYAHKRLHDAQCRESGLIGTVIRSRNGDRVLVHDVEFLSGEPWALKGFAFKKDGTVGSSERRVYASDIPTPTSQAGAP